MSARPGLGALGWRRVALLCAGAASILSGCAYSSLEGPYGVQPDAVARGRALAEQNCSACHGLGLTGESRFPGAPPMRALTYDYNAISYARATAVWHSGLPNMPPAQLSLEDIASIGAYVRSLKEHTSGH